MRTLLSTFTLTLLTAGAATAQVTIEATPFVGAYAPMSDRIVRTDTVGALTQVRVSQQSGRAVGARVAVWTSDRVGFEASIAAVNGSIYVRNDPPAANNPTGYAQLLVASARALLGVGPRSAIGRFYIIGGVGVVSHGGAWKNDWDATTDVGAVLGLAGTFPVGALKLRLGVEQHLYSASFEGSATTGVTPSRLQSDLLITAGVALAR
jgi:hypothetical protein